MYHMFLYVSIDLFFIAELCALTEVKKETGIQSRFDERKQKKVLVQISVIISAIGKTNLILKRAQ